MVSRRCHSRRHDDLAEHLAAFHAFLRLAQLFQRKHRIDHGAEHAPFEQLQTLQQFVATAHVRAEDIVLQRKEKP